eukprot:6482216-Prymnesium_polylepis.1
MIGGCPDASYKCNFVREVSQAVQAVRGVLGGRGERSIAVLADGGVPLQWIYDHVKPDIVQARSIARRTSPRVAHAAAQRRFSRGGAELAALAIRGWRAAAAPSPALNNARIPRPPQPLTFNDVLDKDARAKKLLAYPQTPFKQTVFMDGDTYALRNFDVLFDALGRFDLAAAFECCRLDWSDARTPYDARGFFKGWEMQTGVMA